MATGIGMADQNLNDFYGRIYKIRKTHRRGGGFEAAGTLSRAYFVPPPSRSFPVMRVARPLVMLLAAVTILKALILAEIGPTAYETHVAALQEGDAFDKIGAVLMTPDPVARLVAAAFQSPHF